MIIVKRSLLPITVLAYCLLMSAPLFAQPCAVPPSPVPANGAALAWVAPTKNTDGSNITKAITFTVYDSGTALCTTTSVTAGFSVLAVGAHPFTVTAKTTDGESAASNVATKTVLPSPPNPPTSLTVNGALTAYKQRLSVDGVQMVAFGTIAPGTACDATHSLDGYYLVPRSSVTPASRFDTLPLVAWAKCG